MNPDTLNPIARSYALEHLRKAKDCLGKVNTNGNTTMAANLTHQREAAEHIADVGTRLRKRTSELFDIKSQVAWAATKLEGSDPETAELLAGVARALQHQINTLPSIVE